MSLSTIREQKREWKNLNKRVLNMPSDYQFVYKQMSKYIFKTVALDEKQIIDLITEIIVLFEEGIINNKHVLDVTGRDVASFCDNLTADYDTYMDEIQAKIEENLQEALSKRK